MIVTLVCIAVTAACIAVIAYFVGRRHSLNLPVASGLTLIAIWSAWFLLLLIMAWRKAA